MHGTSIKITAILFVQMLLRRPREVPKLTQSLLTDLLDAKAQVWFQRSPYETPSGKGGIGTGCARDTSVFSRQFYSANVPYSFIHLSPTPHNLSNWQSRWIAHTIRKSSGRCKDKKDISPWKTDWEEVKRLTWQKVTIQLSAFIRYFHS